MGRECSVSLPSLRGDPEAGLAAAVTPESRRASLETLMDTVEEILASREPVVTFIVGEWGEGKTWAWRAHVKPLLLERGASVLEARASTLHEALRRASWIPSPAWRLVVAALVSSGLVENVPGDYRGVAREKVSRVTVVFVDELEDLVYREGAIDEFLEALHALLDGEAEAPTIHFYVAVSPAAYARLAGWPAWRRLRRRVRVVELKPLTRGESLQVLREMLTRAAGTLPLSDPRLLNAVVEAAKGNMGALAAYARRILAAFSRRGCKPLDIEDVVRILSEPLTAGLLDAGIDVEKLGGLGSADARRAVLLMLLEPREASGLESLVEEVEVCEATALDDRVYVDSSGALVAIGGVVEEYVREAGGVVMGECRSGVKALIVKPEIVAAVYGGHPSLASFIRDERVRRRAVREAYREPSLAARGLALLACKSGGCRSCVLGDEWGLVELNLGGYWVRVAVAPPKASLASLAPHKPHVVLVIGGEGGGSLYPRLVGLKVDPLMQIQLAALGYIASRDCGFTAPVDEERLRVLWSLLDSRLEILERIRGSLLSDPPLLIPWASVPASREKVATVLRLLALHGRASPEMLAGTASRLGLHLKKHEIEYVLHSLSRLGIVSREDSWYTLSLSSIERGILAVIGLLGGKCRLQELEERMVEERPGALTFWVKILNIKGYVEAPKRLSKRSTLRLVPLEELRARAKTLLAEIPEDYRAQPQCGEEACERAWLAALEWLVNITRAPGEQHERIETVRVVQPVEAGAVEAGAARSAEAEQGYGVTGSFEKRDESALRLLQRRLLEALRLAPYALLEGRLEELGDAVMRVKQLAARGRVGDASMLLSDTLASIARPPDTSLVVVARSLEPSVDEILGLIEESVAARKALEKIVARRAEALLHAGVARVAARIVRSARQV